MMEISDEFVELTVRILLVIVTVTWGVVLWRAGRTDSMPNFTWRNLISTRDGYPDRVALMELGIWLATIAVLIIGVLRKVPDLATLLGIAVAAFTIRGGAAAVTHAMNPPAPPVTGLVVETDTVTREKKTEKKK